MQTKSKYPLRIIFEDDWLIAFNKPSGLPTQSTRDQKRPDLYRMSQVELAARKPNPISYLGLHHRLDVGTSGIVVMTKRKEINKDFQQLFIQKKIQKTYLALAVARNESAASRAVGESWSIENHLGYHPKSSAKKSFYTAVHSGGDYAKTDFKILEKRGEDFLIEAMPMTGRTHQIRVHLFEDGYCLRGDRLYCDPAVPNDAPRLMLHAWKISFAHPKTKKELTIEAPREF